MTETAIHTPPPITIIDNNPESETNKTTSICLGDVTTDHEYDKRFTTPLYNIAHVASQRCNEAFQANLKRMLLRCDPDVYAALFETGFHNATREIQQRYHTLIGVHEEEINTVDHREEARAEKAFEAMLYPLFPSDVNIGTHGTLLFGMYPAARLQKILKGMHIDEPARNIADLAKALPPTTPVGYLMQIGIPIVHRGPNARVLMNIFTDIMTYQDTTLSYAMISTRNDERERLNTFAARLGYTTVGTKFTTTMSMIDDNYDILIKKH